MNVFKDLFVKSICTTGKIGFFVVDIFKKLLSTKLNFMEVICQIERIGIGSLPIVAASATFIGMAISVQFAREIVYKYGAENMIGDFVAISMLRELAPVFVTNHC